MSTSTLNWHIHSNARICEFTLLRRQRTGPNEIVCDGFRKFYLQVESSSEQIYTRMRSHFNQQVEISKLCSTVIHTNTASCCFMVPAKLGIFLRMPIPHNLFWIVFSFRAFGLQTSVRKYLHFSSSSGCWIGNSITSRSRADLALKFRTTYSVHSWVSERARAYAYVISICKKEHSEGCQCHLLPMFWWFHIIPSNSSWNKSINQI